MTSRKRVSKARKQLRHHAQFVWTREHWIKLGLAITVVLALIGVGLLTRSSSPADAAQPVVARAREQVPSSLKLDSPMATVRTQMDLLESGKDNEFRETFLPYIRDILTAATISGCRDRVTNSPVKPAWDRARDERDAEGRPLMRVTIGNAEVGFHNVEGQWLADYVWCKPAGA